MGPWPQSSLWIHPWVYPTKFPLYEMGRPYYGHIKDTLSVISFCYPCCHSQAPVATISLTYDVGRMKPLRKRNRPWVGHFRYHLQGGCDLVICAQNIEH